MKVTLNLTKLLEEKKITPMEFAKLTELAKSETSKHGYYILVVLTLIAIAVGFIGIAPAAFIESIKLIFTSLGRVGSHILVTALLIFGAKKFNSGFLIGLSAFVILSLLGGETFYSHASYFVAIREPAITVVIFSILSIAALQVSKDQEFDNERLLLIFARACLIIVNMGLWIGSLWGSKFLHAETKIPSIAFVFTWAVALVGVGVWGAREGRSFVVNTCATFGAIHFYTQWFALLGASPVSLFIGGLLSLGILYGFKKYNFS